MKYFLLAQSTSVLTSRYPRRAGESVALGVLLGELLDKVRRPNAEGGSSVPQPSRGVAGTNDSPEEENAKEKTAGGSTTEAVIDLVGGLLDEVAKRFHTPSY